MSLFKILLELFTLYLVYKLIFDFIIPIYHTTKQVKQKVGEMQQKMNEQMAHQQGQPFSETDSGHSSKADKKDYIEFEEVK